MTKPPIPKNEEGRLRALSSYVVVDSLPEVHYDSITRLAATICKVPISLISMIDHDRQVFKSTCGLDVKSTSRDIAFCAHAINTPHEIFLVPDARLDPRFKDNPSVTGSLKVVFYAGYPLVTPEGFALGTLCVMDHEPRELEAYQLEALQTLAQQVMQMLELRRINLELFEHREKLREANQELEEFAYIASHDLKEPVRMVKSFMELLKKRHADHLDEKAQTYINFAVDGAQRMEKMIDDLLDYSRATHNRKHHGMTNLNSVVDEIVNTLNPENNPSKLTVLRPELPKLFVPLSAIRQIFKNLIENAVKYCRDGVAPRVEIRHSESQYFHHFEIDDNGIGIDPKKLKRIFLPFKRVTHKPNIPGTGMGLALCKKLVENYGGEISVSKNSQNGSIFSFTLKKDKLVNF